MHNAMPIEAGFFNKDMGTSYNVHRCVMSDANRSLSPPGATTAWTFAWNCTGNTTTRVTSPAADWTLRQPQAC